MKQVTDDDALYHLDGGVVLCGAHCGTSAKYTGRDISGQKIYRIDDDYARAWIAEIGEPVKCERCGKTPPVRTH